MPPASCAGALQIQCSSFSPPIPLLLQPGELDRNGDPLVQVDNLRMADAEAFLLLPPAEAPQARSLAVYLLVF
jgi:hypothetical protein